MFEVLSELFWNASVEELKQGFIYAEESEEYICLACGQSFADGIIYAHEGLLLTARKYARTHVGTEHTSSFHYLVQLNKKLTGLSDIQRNLLQFFYEGYSDAEIAKELEGGNVSTIRNHRFVLREKEKQAKLTLAIMGLLEEKGRRKQRESPGAFKTPSHVGSRSKPQANGEQTYGEQEKDQILAAYFPQGLDGPLTEFPKKEKRKQVILQHLAKRFEDEVRYSEQEVNEILEQVYPVDYVTLRRYLIEYQHLERLSDGSAYWKCKKTEQGGITVDKLTRKEMVMAYQELPRQIGIFRLFNKVNQKSFIDSSLTLEKAYNRHQFTLNMGSHINHKLQEDWKTYGEAAFEFEVLEKLKERDDAPRNYPYKEELQKLLDKWMEEFQPYAEKGYH